jgi:hypothetical protein
LGETNFFSKYPISQSGLTDNPPAGGSKSLIAKLNYLWRKNFNSHNTYIVLAIVCIIVLFSQLVEHGFLAAMCLIAWAICMPIFSRELRQDKYVLFGYWFVIFLHQVVALINVYIFETFGADRDAAHFHRLSEEFAEHGEWEFTTEARLYVQILGYVYRWFGTSHLLGEELSILAFSFSCVVLMKIIRLLGITRYKFYSLLAFGALPTMIFFGSITLREPYQVVFFMLAVFFGLKMHFKGGINIYIPAFVLSVSLLCVLHKGLIWYGLFIVPCFFIWSPRPTQHLGYVKKLRLVAFAMAPIALLGVVIVTAMLPSGSLYIRVMETGFLDVIAGFRKGLILTPGRTTYGLTIDVTSNLMADYSCVKLYIYYLFAPFPWQIHSILDVYACMESFFRMILICFSVKQWRNAVGSQRRLFGLMLILFFSISFLFALGTANYGTAMRHHMLDWWIIVIIGIPELMTKLSLVRFGRPSH